MGHNEEARVLSHFNDTNPRASFPAIYKLQKHYTTRDQETHKYPPAPTHPIVNLSLRAVLLRRVLAAVAWLLLVI